MIATLLWLVALHPGHMTRLEMRVSDDLKCVETAMKINSIDLESALKRQIGRAVSIESLTDDEAKSQMCEYLKSTIMFQDKPLSKEHFKWIGWEKKPTHVWVYFEIHTLNAQHTTTQLQIRSLFEVEPDMQHVVVLTDNGGDRIVILRESMDSITISLPSK